MKFITIHLICIILFFNSEIFYTCLFFYNSSSSRRIVKFWFSLFTVVSPFEIWFLDWTPLQFGHPFASKSLTIGSSNTSFAGFSEAKTSKMEPETWFWLKYTSSDSPCSFLVLCPSWGFIVSGIFSYFFLRFLMSSFIWTNFSLREFRTSSSSLSNSFSSLLIQTSSS